MQSNVIGYDEKFRVMQCRNSTKDYGTLLASCELDVMLDSASSKRGHGAVVVQF